MDIPLCQSACEITGRIIFEETIPTDPDAKLRVIDEIMTRLAQRSELSEQARFRHRLCLDEALENALDHGNGYDPTKQVKVVMFEDGDSWGVTVSDEGEGFDPATIPNPRSAEGLYKESGRGIFIMSQFMSRVEYFDEGRTVLLQLDRASEERASAAAETPPSGTTANSGGDSEESTGT